MTSYEKRSLYRFLTLYITSVSLLLIIIGYLFYKNGETSLTLMTKYKMLYESHKIEAQIMQIGMQNMQKGVMYSGQRVVKDVLPKIDSKEFKLAFFNKNRELIYGNLTKNQSLQANLKLAIVVV